MKIITNWKRQIAFIGFLNGQWYVQSESKLLAKVASCALTAESIRYLSTEIKCKLAPCIFFLFERKREVKTDMILTKSSHNINKRKKIEQKKTHAYIDAGAIWFVLFQSEINLTEFTIELCELVRNKNSN